MVIRELEAHIEIHLDVLGKWLGTGVQGGRSDLGNAGTACGEISSERVNCSVD